MSIPRRPARPVSWVYSPGVTSACASPFHFTSRSRTTVRAGMLMPRARVSVANTALTRPRTKHSSTVSLNAGTSPAWWGARAGAEPLRAGLLDRRDQPGVVGGEAGEQALAPLPEAEDVQVLLRQRAGALVDDRGDLGALGLVGEPQARPEALGHRLVAAVAGEDERDGRQQAGAVEPL